MNMSSNVPDDVADVLGAEARLLRAFVDRDVVALKSLMGEDLVNTHASGRRDPDRAQFLAGLEQGVRWWMEAPDPLAVRIHGDVAFVTGDQVLHWEGGDPLPVAISQVWMKRGGAWRLVLAQDAPKRPSP